MKKAFIVIVCAVMLTALFPCAASAADASPAPSSVPIPAAAVPAPATTAAQTKTTATTATPATTSPSTSASPKFGINGPKDKTITLGSYTTVVFHPINVESLHGEYVMECKWSGETGKLPKGLTFQFDYENNKAVISGNPTDIGVYAITIILRTPGNKILSTHDFKLNVVKKTSINVNDDNTIDFGNCEIKSNTYTVNTPLTIKNNGNVDVDLTNEKQDTKSTRSGLIIANAGDVYSLKQGESVVAVCWLTIYSDDPVGNFSKVVTLKDTKGNTLCDVKVSAQLYKGTPTITDNKTGKSTCMILSLFGEGAEQTATLREFRDTKLSATEAGRELTRLYYYLSPAAVWLLDNVVPQLKPAVMGAITAFAATVKV